MPFKTQYGSHYHMTEGCHGATIPCGTEGLTPCSDCCGGGGKDGDGSASPIVAGGVPSGVAGDAGEFVSEEPGVAGDAGQPLEEIPQVTIGAQVAAVGLDGFAGGRLAPSHLEITPEMFQDMAQPPLADVPESSLSPEEQRQVDVAHAEYVRATEAEFRRAYTQRVIDEIGEWRHEGLDEWKSEHRDEYLDALNKATDEVSEELRRHPRLLRRRSALVDQRVFAAYERSHPCPYPSVYDSYAKFGVILPGALERTPGYDQAHEGTLAEAERAWGDAKADRGAEEARRLAKRKLDESRTWGEIHGAEARRRHEALDMSVVKGGEPVEHDGIMYEQVDKEAFVGSCRSRHVQPTSSHKDASVRIRPAVPGERVVSYAGDGTEEAVAAGKEGHYVLTKLDHDGNVMLDGHGNPNEWQVEAEKVRRKYDMSEVGEDGTGVARSRPERADVVRVDRNIMIMVPWGDDGELIPQYVRKGGYLNITNPGDVYGISEKDFNDTYLRNDGVRHIPSL